jgi:FkbM family methyltransferase
VTDEPTAGAASLLAPVPPATTDVVHFVEVDVGSNEAVRFAVDGTDRSDPIAEVLRLGHLPGDPVIDLVVALLQRAGAGSLLLDVGAHLGTVSLPAAALGHRVLAVEASPTNARLLRAAVGYGDLHAVWVEEAYAGTGGGEVAFLEHGPWGRRMSAAEAAAGLVPVHVPVVGLDALLSEVTNQVPAVVKVDVMGAELEVCKGMVGLLRRPDAPSFVIASNVAALEARGSSPQRLLGALEQLGFELLLVDQRRERTLVPWTSQSVQVDHAVDVLVAIRPLAPAGWTVAGPLGTHDLVERALVNAAHPVAGVRAHAARVLAELPWRPHEREVALALQTLADDQDPLVRRAASQAVADRC